MEKLKPCPFCGCGGMFVEERGLVYVQCYVCGAQGGKAYRGTSLSLEDAKQNAIFNWNRRPKRDQS